MLQSISYRSSSGFSDLPRLSLTLLQLMANSIGRIPAKKACTLARLLMEKTGYGILPQRSMYPEKYTNHPESLGKQVVVSLRRC